MLTRNDKGLLGELLTCSILVRAGLSVFQAISKHSRVDIVAIDSRNNIYRIQVKTTTSTEDTAVFSLRKCCLDKKYNSFYSANEIDVFALCVEDKNEVMFINSDEALLCKYDITFRFSEAKNKQVRNTRLAANYFAFPLKT